MGQTTLLLLACSMRSDSGVWREGRERGKNKEVKRALTPTPPPRWCFLCSHLFPLSPAAPPPPIWTPGTGNVGVHMKHELYLLEGFLIIAVNVTTIEMNVSSTLFFWPLLWLKQMTTNFIFHSIFGIIEMGLRPFQGFSWGRCDLILYLHKTRRC